MIDSLEERGYMPIINTLPSYMSEQLKIWEARVEQTRDPNKGQETAFNLVYRFEFIEAVEIGLRRYTLADPIISGLNEAYALFSKSPFDRIKYLMPQILEINKPHETVRKFELIMD
jgi:hypothetical protein